MDKETAANSGDSCTTLLKNGNNRILLAILFDF